MAEARTGTRLHPIHLLWRALPARARRRWLARGAALLAPRPDLPPPPAVGGVAVAGELARASGLGEGARLMLAALETLGVPGYPMRAGLAVPGEADPGADGPAPPEGAALVLHVNAPLLPAALLRLPRGVLRGRRIIGYWAWELPVMPPDWRAGIPFVHEAWVPSRFTAAALETLMPGRVRVVPHPVAVRPPRPAALGRDAFGLPEGAVITLVSFSLASSFARKNPLAAIAAHRAAFGDRADRLLLLKLSHAAHHAADLAVLREAIDGAANIRLDARTLPEADSHALTACCDILLSLHRSEGFGLVPAEAMLLGRPVIATGWSGNMDYMDAACAALVGYRLIPAVDPRAVFEAPGAVWAEPDVTEAAAWLRQLADDPAARAALGSAGQAAATARLGTAPLRAALEGIGLVPGAAQ
jgi:glycosyltransferase involved in cell wall biosynthesis